MKVAIEARALLAKSGGIRSYTQNLIQEIKKRDDISLDVISGEASSPVPLASDIMVPYWLNTQIPAYIKRHTSDIIHFTKAAVPKNLSVPAVVTIYDVIPLLLPETQSFLRRFYWPIALKHAATRARHIITISEQSRKDIAQYLHVPEDKITAIPLAIDTTHFMPKAEKKNNTILFVGTWDARKNIPTLISAFSRIAEQIPHTLVLAGKPAHKDDGSRDIARQSQFSDRIQFIENVPYAELPALYSRADVFVFPSAYEGWGFPPQEAMACGTPVIVSDGGSLPEVVGDAGVIVPFSVSDMHARMHDVDFEKRLANSILEIITNPEKRKDMSARGIQRAQSITWRAIADATVSVYNKIL